MPTSSDLRPTPLALTVLGMLAGEPLHPYAIQSRMKAWGKGQVVNLSQRANLYKMIERLRDAGLIAVRQTERDQRFPERTVYELTEEGRRVGRVWLTDMLATPRNEFPDFPAALSFIFGLTPAEAIAALERRLDGLAAREAGLAAELGGEQGPPRIFVIETEYLLTVIRAEREWVRGIVDDLRSGSLKMDWSAEQLAEMTQRFLPPE
jgi:DNA-binding PadR family transcriptional regulator